MRRAIIFAVSLFALLLPTVPSHAVNPSEVLEDPALENRARNLSVQIRCLVCQNQSIDDSDAQLARDLRVLVREQLVEGKSDREILDFLVARYGEFVLLKPVMSIRTILLWSAPFGLLLLGGVGMFIFARRNRSIPVAQEGLSDAERNRISQILDQSKSSKDL